MENQKRLALIATKGTLDWAYPPFILASTGGGIRLSGYWTLPKDLSVLPAGG